MKTKKLAVALGFLAGAGWLPSAMAAVVTELEPNDSLASAMVVEPFFTQGAVADITNSGVSGWEWVSIQGTGNGTYDYYSFYAQAGQRYVFDIDYGMYDLDPEIGLWAASGGGALFQVDDCRWDQVTIVTCDNDPGTIHRYDPMVEWTISAAGWYVIGVARFPSSDGGSGFSGSTIPAGTDYTLQISRNMAAAAVPEPAMLALLSAGLLGFGVAGRRRS